jgi:DnaK suppressor protein
LLVNRKTLGEGVVMNKELVEHLAEQLKRRRSSLIFDGGNREIAPDIVEDRKSELEESAQLDRITIIDNHLEERGQKALRDIEVALERLATGSYGICHSCEEEIGSARLKALPTATLCIDCAKDREKKNRNLMYSHIDFDENA